jgi:hypothetical protein
MKKLCTFKENCATSQNMLEMKAPESEIGE